MVFNVLVGYRTKYQSFTASKNVFFHDWSLLVLPKRFSYVPFIVAVSFERIIGNGIETINPRPYRGGWCNPPEVFRG